MCAMDVSVSPLRGGTPASEFEPRSDATGSSPRPPRSPAVRILATALVAAVSGAAAGAFVVDRHGRTVSSSSSSEPASAPLVHLVTVDVGSIVAAVSPAVVSIRTRPDISQLFESSPSSGEGSGVVIRSDGTILTTAMVATGTRPITVTLADGRSLQARIVGRDPASGIAVLKVAANGLPVARLAVSNRLRVGDDVVALGDALALPGGPTVTRGIVAALARSVALAKNSEPARLTGVLEVTSPLGAANAGGPVVDTQGDVVGVATTAANGDRAPGFAIDVVREQSVIRALVDGVKPSNVLGAEAIDVTPLLADDYGLPVESGALIVSVEPKSPAASAGLRPDDIVVGFARERVATAEDLALRFRDPAVASVSLSVLRGHRPLTITVHLKP
jgi:serine protease Do